MEIIRSISDLQKSLNVEDSCLVTNSVEDLRQWSKRNFGRDNFNVPDKPDRGTTNVAFLVGTKVSQTNNIAPINSTKQYIDIFENPQPPDMFASYCCCC